MNDDLPATGGSWLRDPKTGALTREAEAPEPSDTPTADEAPAKKGTKQ